MSMLVVEQKQGQKFVEAGDRVCDIQIILSGKVELRTANDSFLLEAGSVIGLMESSVGKYLCDYVAVEDTLIVTYAYEDVEDLKKIFTEQPQYIYAFLHATTVLAQNIINRHQELQLVARESYLFAVKQFREYYLLCDQCGIEPLVMKAGAEIKPVKLEKPLHQWEMQYVSELLTQPAEIMKQFYGERQSLCIGEILRESTLMISALNNMEKLVEYKKQISEGLIGRKGGSIYICWFDLARKMTCAGKDLSKVNKKMTELQEYVSGHKLKSNKQIDSLFQKYWDFDFVEYAKTNEEQVAVESVKSDNVGFDYFEYIINYVEYEEEYKAELRQLMDTYCCIVNEERGDAESKAVSDRVTALFFDIYERAFFKSVKTREEVSPILQLFFQFGFMEPRLIEREQGITLYRLNDMIASQHPDHIFTLYDWLNQIYIGTRSTSKNEFDLDYEGCLREMRKVNKITADQEKSLQFDREAMVRFELENLFRAASRKTFDDNVYYSPVLDRRTLTVSPEAMFVSARKIQEAIDRIKEIDFGCFYREIMFYDLEHESGQMTIQKEIMPDVILLPNVGRNAIMWQAMDTGIRESSARIVFPIFTREDTGAMMLKTLARYRWEICKSIQGTKWKDVGEHSITSEYWDYLEYYKKNTMLSSEIRKKIATDVSRCKGDYGEIFVKDYINWIKYESRGSFRLNKVTRSIMSRYCPFSRNIRTKLMDNPMFRNVFTQYDELSAKEYAKAKGALSLYKHQGGEITDELWNHLEFYKR